MAAEDAAAPVPPASPFAQVLENIRNLSQRQKIAAGAALAFLGQVDIGQDKLLDGAPLGALMLGAALLFSFWQLRRAPQEATRDWERRGLSWLAVAGLLFLYLIAPLCFGAEGTAIAWALAGLATLAWALAPDGIFRQAMLYLATTGWLLTLALNASPFMRFDGYFILTDLLDFPNLHERAGVLARAWLRKTLFGVTALDSENLSLTARRALIAFALFTWLYRFTLFLGIAVAVYLLFFKALGIFLFAHDLISSSKSRWHQNLSDFHRLKFIFTIQTDSLYRITVYSSQHRLSYSQQKFLLPANKHIHLHHIFPMHPGHFHI